MWLHLFLRRAPRRGRPPAPPLSKLEKLEDSQSPHLSASAESLRDRRGDVEMAAAAETQTVAGRRRRGWRLGGCLEHKHTRANGGREPRQCARIDRPERARTEAKAHARISTASFARDSRAAEAREARIHHARSHLALTPRAWNNHNIIYFGVF